MKPLCVIQGPFGTRSGYGDMARDIVRHVISMNDYDVILNSMPWGNCPVNALQQGRDDQIISRILVGTSLPKQPDLFIQISVPNEFYPLGKYNIGITAGIETTMCSGPWVDGMNKMDLILTISEHSKKVLESTRVEEKHPQTGATIRQFQLEKPIEILHNCINTDIFKKVDSMQIAAEINSQMSTVSEDFNFLFVGHWLQGDIGEDRKNVGMLIKLFGETFKHTISRKKPGLILKTSGADFSLLDHIELLRRIDLIKKNVGDGCPNIYLLHGDLTEEEMNGLYNHPKVKAHVSFTKGEGFGRPLLEATQSQKPVIASGWSGHLDFLNNVDAVLVGGELRDVEENAIWENVIIRNSKWFNVDPAHATSALKFVFDNYDECKTSAKKLAKNARTNFAYPVIEAKTHELIRKYVPKFVPYKPMNLSLPHKLPSLKSAK